MEPKFVEKEAFKVVGMRDMFTMQNNTIPQLWEAFAPRIKEVTGNEEMPVCYGVCFCDPADPMEPNAEFEQIASVEGVEGREVPKGMIERKIEASKYAVFTHKGKIDSLGDTYGYIYGVWAIKSGHKIKAGNMFEMYDERFKHGKDDSEMDIYIPIE